jgi:hypothetical protein
MTEKVLIETGYLILPPVIEKEECDKIIECIAPLQGQGAGTRTLLINPWCKLLASQLAGSPQMLSLLPPIIALSSAHISRSLPTEIGQLPFIKTSAFPLNNECLTRDVSGWSERKVSFILSRQMMCFSN